MKQYVFNIIFFWHLDCKVSRGNFAAFVDDWMDVSGCEHLIDMQKTLQLLTE